MSVPFPVLLEVSAVSARAQILAAAAVLTAAVAVYGLVVRRDRRLRREAVSERLVAGCAARDNAVLRGQVEVFRRRLAAAVAADAVVASAGVVVDDALSRSRVDPSSEGGPK